MAEPRAGWLYAVRSTDHRGQTVTTLCMTRGKADRLQDRHVEAGREATVWATRVEWEPVG